MTLDSKKPAASFKIEAPAGVTALRIAMNAEDDTSGKNAFQFAAFSSKDAASSENACKDNGSGQFAFCAIDKPANGTWTFTVSRKKGQGQVQVQITTLFVGPNGP